MTEEEKQEYIAKIKKVFPDHPNPSVELVGTDHVVEEAAPLLARLTSAVAPPQKIVSSCSNKFRAVHHSGHRDPSVISCEVIHCGQAMTAIGMASWFANSRSAGSAHRCADDRICYRTLSDDLIPWAAPGMNLYGNHFEMAGFDFWSNETWHEKHEITLRRAAYKTALDAKHRKFPVQWLSVHELQNGNRHGITDHWAVSHAFHLSTHHDPRDSWTSHEWGWPQPHFMELTKWYRGKL